MPETAAARTPVRFFRHKFPLADGSYTAGKINVERWVRSYRLPSGFFEGRRVLDIGAWSGGFGFYFEKLGAAEVVALDVMPPQQSGFEELKSIVGARARLVPKSIYDIAPENEGTFDAVFYQGVFYHLKHPLLALERINAVMPLGGVLFGGGTTCDTYFSYDGRVINPTDLAFWPMAFFVEDVFLGDRSNWWIPNRACVAAWLKRSGFKCDWIETREGAKADGGQRSIVSFVARKVSVPEPEFL